MGKSMSLVDKSASSASSSERKMSSSSSSTTKGASNTSSSAITSGDTMLAPMPPMRHMVRMFSDDGQFGHNLLGRINWVDDQVISMKNDADKGLQVSLDTHHYKPEEVEVVVHGDGVLKIEGKHEEKADDGSRFVSRQFKRQYTLPPGCKPENVVSNLSADGVLMVTAAKDGHQIKHEPARTVPILKRN